MSRKAALDILSPAALAHPCASQGPHAVGMRPSRIAAGHRQVVVTGWYALTEVAA